MLERFGGASSGRVVFGKPVKPKQLLAFTRQLATLLQAGMPLLRGLRLLQEQVQMIQRTL
jgi:type II secretory pathway component PulF